MYTQILHATDLKENHYDLCKKAMEISRSLKATLHILHVIEPPPLSQLAQGLGFAELATPVKDDAKIVLKLLGESLGIPKAQLHLAVGSIKQHVLETIKDFSCDLLIVGSHEATNHLPAFLDSTAHAAAHHAPCDVLTIR